MNWTPIYAALEQVATLTGIPASSIGWSDQPRNSDWTMGPKLTMAVKSDVGLGFDYEERVDGTPAQLVTVVGQRQFMWEIRCEVQNSDPATVAIFYLDKLRARLSRSTTEAILLAAGLAVVELQATQQVGNVASHRTISTYVMEALMACAENDVDDSTDAGGYITSVGITSNKLQLPDGSDAPQQIVETIGP